MWDTLCHAEGFAFYSNNSGEALKDCKQDRSMVRYTFFKRSLSQYNGDNTREEQKRKQQKIVLSLFFSNSTREK